jgi:hypothetical protein
MTQPNYDSMVDTNVTIRGVARDARMGAVVLPEDRTPIYIDGLEEWDDDVSGESIEVTGMLRRRKLAPDPVVGADGGVSHGIHGDNFVLEDPAWSVLSAP